MRLQRAIQCSEVLQVTLDAVKVHSRGASDEQIQKAIAERLAIYRVAGLDALHDLATMPLDANSAQNQVKLAAAARLAGTVEAAGGSGLEEILRELNSQYQKEAPRLRVIRERVTIEQMPPERIVSDSG